MGNMSDFTSSAIASAHQDPIAPVIFSVTLILTAALVGRHLARKLHQPTVLGELLVGVLLGNVLYLLGSDLVLILREGTVVIQTAQRVLAGGTWEAAAQAVLGDAARANFLIALQGAQGVEYLQVAQAVDIFSRYGVIFLLFHVGLDTRVSELRRVGGDALRVAAIGVLGPLFAGYLAAWALAPGNSHTEYMFLGAALGATSIGITARVLQDLHRQSSPEAHVILGAAVLDDVFGLTLLAIVSGIVVSGSVQFGEILRTALLAGLFIVSVLYLGPYLIRWLTRLLRHLDEVEAKIFISFVFVMTLAWLANLVGLATIVGAFAAGLLITDSHFKAWECEGCRTYQIKQLFAPLEAILVPIFFVLMGLQVKLETLAEPGVGALALALTAAALAGKLVAAFGVTDKRLNRLAVGVGMLPRGEVGLVFASIGRSLGVVSAATFSAIVIMVVVTTLVTPPLLKWALTRRTLASPS
jgi:Kef-type K+ transport system membrane component KefB